MKKILILIISLFAIIEASAWTSSNQGTNYTLEDIALLTDDINYIGNSQYDISCDIIILENDTLTLNEGEELLFLESGNSYGVTVEGTLKANGIYELPIMLGNGIDIWSGIKFINTSSNGESILEHCKLVRAHGCVMETAILCNNSSPIIN